MLKPALMDFYDYVLIKTTTMAFLVRDYNDQEFWIPKSHMHNLELGKDLVDENGQACKEIISFAVPEWLAEKNDMV